MYTVYKIINLVNSKYYIGVHKTDNPNDDYYGSGRAIKNAISKYGKNNFKKEILHIVDSSEEAYILERQLTCNYNLNDNYNMRLGGVGGFTSENAKMGYKAANWSKEDLSEFGKRGYKAANWSKEDLSEFGRRGGLSNKGKKLSEEHKNKIRLALKNSNTKRCISEDKIKLIKELRQQGLSNYKISEIVGVSRNTVMKYWK